MVRIEIYYFERVNSLVGVRGFFREESWVLFIKLLWSRNKGVRFRE